MRCTFWNETGEILPFLLLLDCFCDAEKAGRTRDEATAHPQDNHQDSTSIIPKFTPEGSETQLFSARFFPNFRGNYHPLFFWASLLNAVRPGTHVCAYSHYRPCSLTQAQLSIHDVCHGQIWRECTSHPFHLRLHSFVEANASRKRLFKGVMA